MSQKKISIIIPCFNREKLIIESLNSVLQQTYTNWECILVDDGSTDTTVQTIEKFSKNDSRFRLICRNREPKGAPTCRNIGISLVQGEYFMFLDSDDILNKNCLTNRVLSAKSTPEYDAWVFPSQYFKNGKLIDKKFYSEDSITHQAWAFLLRPQWPINGSFFDSVKFKCKITLFNENMPFWQDWEFHINCLLQGLTFCQHGAKQPDTFIRTHENISRINNQREFDPTKIHHLYTCLFDIHTRLKGQKRFDDSFFQYRLLYLIEYLIYRGGSTYTKVGQDYLDKLDADLDLHYRLLNYVSNYSKNSYLGNKLLSHLYSKANKILLRNQISKLPR